MKNLLKIIYLILSLLLLTKAAFGLTSEWSQGDMSKVRLISPFSNNNNQDQIILGLQYSMEPGWKTYWKSPGDGGFPQTLIWDGSKNVKEITLQWPKPKEFEILGLRSIGYENDVIFPLIIDIKDKTKITNLDISINYLVCKDICIPGNARIFLDLPPGSANTTEFYYLVEKAISSLPVNNKEISFINNFKTKAYVNQDNILLEVKAETNLNFNNPEILIHTPFGLPVINSIIDYSLDYKSLSASFNFDKKLITDENFIIEVLLIDKNHNFSFIDNIELEESNKFNLSQNPILFYILVSLVGGLILNLMPCVLPVLSIKIMSVLKNDIKEARISFIFTSFGIVFSFVALGLTLLVLKKLGISISWGMQFQQPYFLVMISAVIFLFMMNMFDQFEFKIPKFISSSKFINKNVNSYSQDFFNGFFATLMATPCSAPFVGTAVTAAFTQSSAILLTIFFFLGLGMSTPYLLICFFPQLVSYLPKPGIWMKYLKYFLGFLLFLTTLWLSNILLNFFNFYFIFSSILLLIILIYRKKLIYFNNPISFIVLLLFLSLPTFSFFEQNEELKLDKEWQNFSSIKINELIKENIVFLDITADWCATCQFNKVNVLNSDKIKNLFASNKVILVRGDWTKPNKNINKFLNNYNRFGIPFNAFFSSSYPEGLILSELLSEKEINNAINIIKK